MTRVLLGGRNREVPTVDRDAGGDADDDHWPDHDAACQRAC